MPPGGGTPGVLVLAPATAHNRNAMRRAATSILLAAAGCWLACTGSEPAADGGGARNLLLVTLDTLRADHLGSYGYAAARTPHLDALAGRGLRFAQAATVTPLTLPAHSSLMTGTFPAYHGVRDNGGFYLDDEAETLAEVLAAAGWRTGGFVGAFVLDSRWGIAQGFEHYFDDFDLTRFDDAPGMDAIQRPGSEVVDRALAWLAADRERPFFAWVHLYDPHTPYAAPEPFRSRFPATLTGAYDAEIAATDAQVGRLIQALDDDGRLADTLVVVLADHGEMLGQHGEATHGFFIYDPAVRIPLIVAGPGIAPAVIEDQVRIVDVMPTVLARLGVEPPAAVQGVDLMPLTRGRSLRLAAQSESYFPLYHYGWSELASIQDGRYKYVRAPRPELYDLQQDPGEQHDLAAQQPERAARMAAALERLLASVASPRGERRPQAADAETAARLRALGYLGGGGRPAADDGVERADPKDKIGLYNLLKEATAAAAGGDLDEAIARVRRLLAEDPEVVEAHLLHGNFLRRQERYEDAAAAYREALARNGEHHEALLGLALAYKELGRLDDALAGLERAHRLDPRNGKVLWQIADVEMRAGRYDAAEKALLQALELDLDRPRFLTKLGELYLEAGRPAEAVERLRRALEHNPELRGANFHLGLAYEQLRRPADAIAAYRAELELHDGAFRASFNLAKLLLDAGRPQEAIPYFRRTVEIQPELGTAYLYLAKALLDAGQLEAAADAARTGLEHRPEPRLAPLGHFVLADVYSRQGRTADAEREAAAGRRLQRAAGGR
ncbi:MAG: tetratricopeptide repeat protein [Acidobacteria bacterium]|nr:MAG: tetratricopeptide repeat protein [Acidobacteriota bacterium]